MRALVALALLYAVPAVAAPVQGTLPNLVSLTVLRWEPVADGFDVTLAVQNESGEPITVLGRDLQCARGDAHDLLRVDAGGGLVHLAERTLEMIRAADNSDVEPSDLLRPEETAIDLLAGERREIELSCHIGSVAGARSVTLTQLYRMSEEGRPTPANLTLVLPEHAEIPKTSTPLQAQLVVLERHGKSYDVELTLHNATDQAIVVRTSDLECWRGDVQGRVGIGNFGIGQRNIDLGPDATARSTLFCDHPKNKGPARFVVRSVWSNPSGDGHTVGDKIASEVSVSEP